MAAYGGFKIISIDYRMPPDHPYPAGLDDCLKVWRVRGLFGHGRNPAALPRCSQPTSRRSK